MPPGQPPRILGAALAVAFVVAGATGAAAESFVNFESGHVRPLALASDGSRLFAVNTPDNRLAIYDVTDGGLTLAAEVPVGLEPVAVATRVNAAGRTEAWVVNHLSDSVSIVEVDPADAAASRVTRTLLVGDEPRDILFAGAGGTRAFVTCAHRGQNRPGDPDLTTEGVGRADVWVFDATSLGAALGGTPVGGAPLTVFADTPRALAKSPDGSIVYAAAFQSGNQTTTILERIVSASGGLPPPPAGSTPDAPSTGLIVKFDGPTSAWLDEIGRDWGPHVAFTLPDLDVFLIDADATPPALAAGPNTVAHVGTVLFNMAVNPANGKLYVSNTDAQNHVRFEPLLRADLARSRITVVTGTDPLPVDLNSHIDRAVPPTPEVADRSLAFPMDMVVSNDGTTLYAAAFGSGKVGVFDTAALESGVADASQVAVGLGPSGLALDEGRNRLYVMNFIDHTISIVGNVNDPALRAETAVVPLRYDPESPAIRNGRRFLYDARLTSGYGDQACASCHVFGDMDGLAWDLGNPEGLVKPNFHEFRVIIETFVFRFHPMKGPMTTQSLRGMAGAGPMHWRGDKTGAVFSFDERGLDEDLAFKEFNPAFVGLMGRSTELTAEEMQAFTDFILTVRYPPNPIRRLDNQLTAAQANGQDLFFTRSTIGPSPCNFCHKLPLGTDGLSSSDEETQEFKIPHLRNMYQMVGMFGLPDAVLGSGLVPTGFVGDQIRGFGFTHDGAIPTVADFLSLTQFRNLDPAEERDLEALVLAFNTGLAPVVGQQVSATPATVNSPDVVGRIDLFIARAAAGDCDLVVKGVVAGQARGWVYLGGNQFQPDRNSGTPLGRTALRNLAGTPGQELTYTCVPPGSGTRIGVDRDEDGVFDRSELDAGTDPASATTTTTSIPPGTTTTTLPAIVRIRATAFALRDDVTAPINPGARRITFRSDTRRDAAANDIVVPPPGSAGDPTLAGAGATLALYNSAGLAADIVQASMPAAGWAVMRSAGGFKGYRYTSRSGVIRHATVTDHRIVLRGGRRLLSYTLDEPAQGSIVLRLTLGTGTTWCAEGGRAPFGRRDRPGRFETAEDTPAPSVCP
jgi:DNA-binding beta-propeller fold protein YncE